MSKRKRRPKADKSFRVIPEYRDSIDVCKLCKVLIYTAREMAQSESHKKRKAADK